MADLVFRLVVKDDGSAVIERFGQTVDKTVKRSRRAASVLSAGFTRLRRGINRLPSAIFNVRNALLGLAVGFVIRELIQTFVAFEKELNLVRALTEATGDQFELLKTQAKTLGETTVFTAREAAEAQAFFAKAGFEVNEILGALPDTLNLAAAGQLNLGRATSIVTGILRGLRIPFEDLSNAVDILVKGFTSSKVTLETLGQSFKFVGPIAITAGLEFTEITAILGVLGDSNIEASLAGTSLRRAIINLIAPSTKAQDTLDRLGVTTRKGSGELRSFTDILEDVSKALTDPAELVAIFGVRAVSAVDALAKNIPKIREAQEALRTVGEEAKRVAEERLRGLTGSLKLMESAVEGAKISIGEELAPAIRDAADAITEFARTFTPAIAALNQTADASGRLATNTSSLRSTLDTIIPSAEGFIKAFFFIRGGILSAQILFFKFIQASAQLQQGLVKVAANIVSAYFTLQIKFGEIFNDLVKIQKEALTSLLLFVSTALGKVLNIVARLPRAIPGIAKVQKTISSLAGTALTSAIALGKMGVVTADIKKVTGQAASAQLIFNGLLTGAASAEGKVTKRLVELRAQLTSLGDDERDAIDRVKKIIEQREAQAKALDVAKKKTGLLKAAAKAVADEIKEASKGFTVFGKAAEGATASVLSAIQTAQEGIGTFRAAFEQGNVDLIAGNFAAREKLIAQEKDAGKKSELIEQAKSAFIVDVAGSALATIVKLTDREGKKAFIIQKAIAIASAIVSTAKGITAAIALGPFGIPLAGVIAGIGAAQIAAIASAKPGGGGGAVTAGGGGGGGGAVAAVPPAEAVAEAIPPAPVGPQISISVAGFIGDEARLAEEIARVSREAIGDGLEFGVQASRR